MKKGLLTTVILLITIASLAQPSVGKIRLRPEYYQTDLKKKDLEKLKDAKTFFVVPSQFNEGYTKEEYEEILKKSWTISPIKVIENSEISEHLEIGNVFIRFKSNGISITRRMTSTYIFNYFKVGVVNKIKEKKEGGYTWWEDFYAVVFFTADVNARLEMASLRDTVYGDLLDYRLGYIKNYFQQLNNGIKESESHNIYDDYVDEENIKVLKEVKLHVPKNILYGYNALTGNESKKSSEELFEEYNYDYIVVDENELSDKILNSEEPFYYLMYHQKNAHKIITVVESTTGKIIYRRHTKTSWNIKPKDIKTLMKRVNKS